MPNNYMFYKIRDEAVYPNMTFDNLVTLGFVVGALTLTTLAFYLGNKFTEGYKKPRIKELLEKEPNLMKRKSDLEMKMQHE